MTRENAGFHRLILISEGLSSSVSSAFHSHAGLDFRLVESDIPFVVLPD